MNRIIKDNCLLCSKSFNWHEVVIGKMPENVWFCQKCTECFEDNNVYKGINSWIVIDYEKEIELEFKS